MKALSTRDSRWKSMRLPEKSPAKSTRMPASWIILPGRAPVFYRKALAAGTRWVCWQTITELGRQSIRSAQDRRLYRERVRVTAVAGLTYTTHRSYRRFLVLT